MEVKRGAKPKGEKKKDKIVIFVEKGKIAKHGIETIRKVCYKNIEKHLK